MEDESPARWLLHLARLIRKDSGRDPAWWEDDNRFCDTRPALWSNGGGPSENRDTTSPGPDTAGSQRLLRESAGLEGSDAGQRATDPGITSRDRGEVQSAGQKQKRARRHRDKSQQNLDVLPRAEGAQQEDTLHPRQNGTIIPMQAAAADDEGGNMDVRPVTDDPVHDWVSPPISQAASPPWDLSQSELHSAHSKPTQLPLAGPIGQVLVRNTPSQPHAETQGPQSPHVESSSGRVEDDQPARLEGPVRPNLPPGVIWAAEELRESAPFHCLGLGSLSTRFPHRFWGHQLSLGIRPEHNIARFLRCHCQVTVDTLPEIMQERLTFRQEVVWLTHQTLKSSYGNELAQLTLRSQISVLRDIFVGRVARILLQKFKCKEQSALGEAISMAVQDGLYDEKNPLLSINLEDKKVSLDLRATIPKSEQNEGYDIELPEFQIPSDSQENQTASPFLRYFRPVWAPGLTERECQRNVVINLNALHQVHVDKHKYQVPARTDGIPPEPPVEFLDVLGELFDPEVARKGRSHLHWENFQLPRVMSKPGVKSVFSTGRIAPAGSSLPPAPGEPPATTSQLQEAFDQEQSYIQQEWATAVEQDQEKWNEWVSNFNAGFTFVKTHDNDGNSIPPSPRPSSAFTGPRDQREASATSENPSPSSRQRVVAMVVDSQTSNIGQALAEYAGDPIVEFTDPIPPRPIQRPYPNIFPSSQAPVPSSDGDSVHTTDEEDGSQPTNNNSFGLAG